MTKFIATTACLAALTALSLGNYYYTFGLWPKSWGAFFGFFAAFVTVNAILTQINKEKD